MPRGYPANKPYMVTAVSQQYADDIHKAYRILLNHCNRLKQRRNLLISQKAFNFEIENLNEQIDEDYRLTRRFLNRFKKAQKKLNKAKMQEQIAADNPAKERTNGGD